MDTNLLAVTTLVVVALIFDYINGFHDAANSIATVVSTRVLTPGKAVIWAAFFNFVAAFTFGTAVAKTVGSGLVDISVVTFAVIFAGLVGAIIWDLITWYYGLPTSSSHAWPALRKSALAVAPSSSSHPITARRLASTTRCNIRRRSTKKCCGFHFSCAAVA